MLFKTVSFKEHPLNREDMICYIFCISLEFIFSMREIKLKYVDVTCSTIITKKKKENGKVKVWLLRMSGLVISSHSGMTFFLTMRNLEEDIASSQAKLFMKDRFLASKLNFNFSFLRHPPFKFPIGFHFHFLYPSDILPFLFLSSCVAALSSIMPLQPFMILVFVPQEFEFSLPSSLCAIIYSAASLLC